MTTNRIDVNEAYMQMAEIWAQRSYATRSKVGALMVKDKQIISDGYNGMPHGFPNEEVEYYEDAGLAGGVLTTNPLVLHAESNAILKCAKNGGVSSEGSTLYVTMTPCLQCCKLIIQAGIKQVFYRDAYRDMSSLAVLERAGIPVVQLPKV
jgi:dCMP deaminase